MISFCPLLLFVTALVPASAATPIPSCVTPFEMARPGEIVVTASVNGAGPYRFIVDTGSSHSAVDETVAREVGAPAVARTIVTTPLGSEERAVIHLGSIRVGSLTATAVLASVVRRGAFGGARRIDGLIGQDVLGPHRYTIDFARQQLVWGDQAPHSGAILRLIEQDGRYIVELPQRHRILRLVPDSASAGLVLFQRDQDDMPGVVPQAALTELSTLNARRAVRDAIVRELRVGSARLRNVPAIILPARDQTPPSDDGLLPLHLFDRVTFDGHARLLSLSRSSHQ